MGRTGPVLSSLDDTTISSLFHRFVVFLRAGKVYVTHIILILILTHTLHTLIHTYCKML